MTDKEKDIALTLYANSLNTRLDALFIRVQRLKESVFADREKRVMLDAHSRLLALDKEVAELTDWLSEVPEKMVTDTDAWTEKIATELDKLDPPVILVKPGR